MNDCEKLIETVFLIAKTSPNKVQHATCFEKKPLSDADDDDEQALGAVDEKFSDMPKEMELLDVLFKDKEETEPIPV
jgi:hypothetical protein